MKKSGVFLLITACIVLLDQGIKHVIRQAAYGQTLFVFPGFFEILHCVNTGAAFSLLSGRTFLIGLFSVGLLVALIVLLRRYAVLTFGASIALAVLMGGGIGNLIDRFVFGGVTDYIRLLLFSFPVFNFADICITLSIAYLFFQMLTGQLDPQRKKT